LSAGVNAFVATYTNANSVVSTQAFVITGDTYTQFVYSPGGNKLAVVQNGALVKGTIPLPGGESAIYNASGLNYIRHTDWPGSPATGLRRWGGWLGSSRLATTWTHGVYAKEAYAPFGETYNEAGAPDRSFTGQDQDTTSGVYDFLFRKYDPVAGRWLSPDPAGWGSVTPEYPQSLDRYAYVQNNPNSLIDANGLDCVYLNDDGSLSGIATGDCGSDDNGFFINNPEGTQVVNATGNDNGDLTSFTLAQDSPVNVYVYASPDFGLTLPDASYPTQTQLSGYTVYPGAPNGPGAPSNGQTQYPQKKPCSTATRIGGAIQALNGLGDAAGSLNLSGVHVATAGLLLGLGCLEPTPFEPVTCAASGFGAISLLGGAFVLSDLAVMQVKEEVIPGFQKAFDCTE
jgi:RHS repeat-associated protein